MALTWSKKLSSSYVASDWPVGAFCNAVMVAFEGVGVDHRAEEFPDLLHNLVKHPDLAPEEAEPVEIRDLAVGQEMGEFLLPGLQLRQQPLGEYVGRRHGASTSTRSMDDAGPRDSSTVISAVAFRTVPSALSAATRKVVVPGMMPRMRS